MIVLRWAYLKQYELIVKPRENFEEIIEKDIMEISNDQIQCDLSDEDFSMNINSLTLTNEAKGKFFKLVKTWSSMTD